MNIQAFDFSVNLLRSLLWQYNNAPGLTALLELKQRWYNEHQTDFWTHWIKNIFDLRTANNFGLSVWSRILDLPLFTRPERPGTNFPQFGFGPDRANFADGLFRPATDEVLDLTVEQKRKLLQLRYRQLTSSGTIPDINRDLNFIFGERVSYVLDGYNMSMTWVMTRAIDTRLRDAVLKLDLLPRPAGVKLNLLTTTERVFGFGSDRINFFSARFGIEHEI